MDPVRVDVPDVLSQNVEEAIRESVPVILEAVRRLVPVRDQADTSRALADYERPRRQADLERLHECARTLAACVAKGAMQEAEQIARRLMNHHNAIHKRYEKAEEQENTILKSQLLMRQREKSLGAALTKLLRVLQSLRPIVHGDIQSDLAVESRGSFTESSDSYVDSTTFYPLIVVDFLEAIGELNVAWEAYFEQRDEHEQQRYGRKLAPSTGPGCESQETQANFESRIERELEDCRQKIRDASAVFRTKREACFENGYNPHNYMPEGCAVRDSPDGLLSISAVSENHIQVNDLRTLLWISSQRAGISLSTIAKRRSI